MKNIILSIDLGFNGIKGIVGTPESALFAFHLFDDIVDITGKKSVGAGSETVLSNSVIIKDENQESFIVGNEAKRYLRTGRIEKMKNTDFYSYNTAAEESAYKRFTTPLFKKVQLAAIQQGLVILSLMKGYEDVLTSNDYSFDISFQLPIAISGAGSSYRTILEENIKKDNNLGFQCFTESGKSEILTLPENIRKADIHFSAQAVDTFFCELESDDNIQLPALVLDCGGRTIGITFIEETMEIRPGYESNTEFAIDNVNMATYNKLKEIMGEEGIEFSGLTEENIEEYASSEKGKQVSYLNKSKEIVDISITEIYNQEAEKKAHELYNYLKNNKEHLKSLVQSRTILVSGGTGNRYYITLKNDIAEIMKDKTPVVLAKGESNGHEFGPIFSVALGGFKRVVYEKFLN